MDPCRGARRSVERTLAGQERRGGKSKVKLLQTKYIFIHSVLKSSIVLIYGINCN